MTSDAMNEHNSGSCNKSIRASVQLECSDIQDRGNNKKPWSPSRLTINNLLIYGKEIACSSIVPLDEVISYSRQFTYAEMMTLLSLLSLPRALAAQASSHRVVANLKKIIGVL